MSKILWYGDACCNTGFGRVTHSILDHLHKNHEVTVIGINYNGDPHTYPYTIYPAATTSAPDRFGLQRIAEIVSAVKPDVFIGLNDIWVLNQVWEKFQFVRDEAKTKFFGYFPTDSESYYPDMLSNIQHWDVAATFTTGGGHRIGSHPGHNIERLAIIPHGVDTARFKPMSQDDARDQLRIPKDKFIVLNANRNQPRKRIDLTVEAFAEFAIGKPDTALYLHMGTKDLGWDIVPMFERAMRRRNLDATNRLILTADSINYIQAPPDEFLNLIYNACDVGINTADGEGWGLVSFEHASCRKPQVVPRHTACVDIWDQAAVTVPISTWVTDKDLGVVRGLIDTHEAAESLTELYTNPDFYQEVAECCYTVTQRPEYRWENVAGGFSSIVSSLVA